MGLGDIGRGEEIPKRQLNLSHRRSKLLQIHVSQPILLWT